MLFNRLFSLLSARFGRIPEADPFEGYIDVVPEPPETLCHIVMPGRYRPYVLTSHATHLEAVIWLEFIAANFAAEGWFVYRETPSLWRLYKQVEGEDLMTSLGIVSSEELAKAHV